MTEDNGKYQIRHHCNTPDCTIVRKADDKCVTVMLDQIPKQGLTVEVCDEFFKEFES